jgi:hypothetical protein
MFSFLRESDRPDGKPGPLSMRRIGAGLCITASIVCGILAIIAIIKFIGLNPDTTIDWKAFIPLFVPCIAFLLGGILLLLFTTWSDIRGVITEVATLKKE